MKRKLDIKAIDITNVDKDNETFWDVVKIIDEECKSTGFFMMKMPDSVAEQTEAIIDSAKKFFKLPLDKKQKLKNCPSSEMKLNGVSVHGTGCGYRGYSEDPNFQSDTRESFNMGPDVDSSLALSPEYSGSGVTDWPDEKLLPGWKAIMQKYSNSILSTVVPVLQKLFAAALGLTPEFFEKSDYFERPTWLLGLTNYSAVKSDESSGVYGIRPHCDSGMFTLLLSDGKPGLQICLDKSVSPEDREWLDVDPPPFGYFIVNLGQVLERWSNGVYKATMHRVMLDGSTDRLSVPFFYDPNFDLVIKPLITNHSECDKSHYLPQSLGQIMLDRLKKSNGTFE